MSQSVELLRVLVASPSDVAEERLAVGQLIDEFNQSWGPHNGVILAFLGWEQFPPGIGVEPQAVVDASIADNYDIFVGVLWTRFGTETSDAGSGTEHEFNRAVERYNQNTNCLRIMMYFSDAHAVPSAIDAHQLDKVNVFRGSLPKKGVVYQTYGNLGEFIGAFRLHLAKVIQDWGNGWGGANCGGEPTHAPNLDTRSDAASDDDVGFLDLIESGNEDLAIANARATAIGAATEKLGAAFTSPTAQGATAAIDAKDMVKLKAILNELASELTEFGDAINATVPEFAETYARAINAYGRAAIIAHKINPADSTSLMAGLDSLRVLDAGLKDARPQIASFAEVLDNLPAVTTVFARAKRVARGAAAVLLREWDKASAISEDLNAVLSSLIPDDGSQSQT